MWDIGWYLPLCRLRCSLKDLRDQFLCSQVQMIGAESLIDLMLLKSCINGSQKADTVNMPWSIFCGPVFCFLCFQAILGLWTLESVKILSQTSGLQLCQVSWKWPFSKETLQCTAQNCQFEADQIWIQILKSYYVSIESWQDLAGNRHCVFLLNYRFCMPWSFSAKGVILCT